MPAPPDHAAAAAADAAKRQVRSILVSLMASRWPPDGLPMTSRWPPSERGSPLLRTASGRQVVLLIEAREATVGWLRVLLPTPSDERDGARLARQIFEEPSPVHAQHGASHPPVSRLLARRERFAALVGLLRLLSVGLHDATQRWRAALRRASDHHRGLPDAEIPFYWGTPSMAYSLRMCTDLAFLPLPALGDPLLIEWYGRQLPWMLEHVNALSRLARAAEIHELANLTHFAAPSAALVAELAAQLPAAAAAATFRACGLDGPHASGPHGASHGAESEGTSVPSSLGRQTPQPVLPPLAKLRSTQAAILAEAARCGLASSAAGLLKHARKCARGSGRWSSSTWRWSAYEALLYGHSGSYVPLLKQLPKALDAFAAHDAAVLMQEAWRSRLARKLMRAVMQANALERAKQVAAILRKQEGAANTLQKSVRARLLRRAFQDTTSALLHRSAMQNASAEAQCEMEAARLAEAQAAGVIQRRNRVVSAKREVQRSRVGQRSSLTAANDLLGQVSGVAMLARQLARYRASRHVMWRVFRHAVLDHYEQVSASCAPMIQHER